MPTTYQKCGADVRERMKDVQKKYHADLEEAGVKISLLFAESEKDEHGNPFAPAVTVGGYPCAAKVKIIGLKERADGRADAEIVIDRDEWDKIADPQRDALLDHELYHLEPKRDEETGAVVTDDLGRPKLKIRKHDHQFGWFDMIAKRHGAASYEVSQARNFADAHGQVYFGFAVPPGTQAESLPAAKVDDAAKKINNLIRDSGATVTFKSSDAPKLRKLANDLRAASV